ncbi:MAG: T9SS type A sorting domain-containing protein, partial [Melioribacteraceae bacterium]|nr:T9SS type A sorting domain-containing protein [Melioribacteraceae bacterium]
FDKISTTLNIIAEYIESKKFVRIPEAILDLLEGMNKIVIIAINDAENDETCVSPECAEKLNEAKSEYSKVNISIEPESITSNVAYLTNAWKLAIGVINNASESIVAIEDNSGIPTEYGLGQNFPNPFNPSTIISYQLPKSSYVNISIYDILGNLVTKLVDREMQAGYHTVSWNASNLSNGVYFYTIRSGSFIATKKLLLLK